MLKQNILNALRRVEDPDLKKDLVTLEMVQDLIVLPDSIQFTIKLTTPACPLKEVIKKKCIDAIREQVGKDLTISIKFTAQVTSSRVNIPILPKVKNIIAIASGKGGVGKSTLASNMAITLAKLGAQVGLLDADIFGPSIPAMWGCVGKRPEIIKQSGKQYMLPLQRHGVKLLSIGFLAPSEEAMVWRGPMASSALKQLIKDSLWGELDYLLIDLPPGTSDIHLTVMQTATITGAVIVTTPQHIALIDAIKGISMFRKPAINVPILGLVENMAYFTPVEFPAQKYYIFGEGGGVSLAHKEQIPFLGQVPLLQSLQDKEEGRNLLGLGHQAHLPIFNSIVKKLAQQVVLCNEK